MRDYPIPAKIILTLAENELTGVEFLGLAASLYKQNLIFSEPQTLRRNKNTLELTITFRDIASYKFWMKNFEIKEYWAPKFDKLLTVKHKTLKEFDIIIELDKIENCTCNNSDYYILQGRSLQFIDELICNKCLGHISYSKVPLEIKLEDWQKKHQRVYLNWLESGLFEKEAYKELTNYKKGKLNLAGEKIRQELSEFFQTPVYINYFVEEADQNHPCLLCKQQGIESGLKKLNRICKTCNTIYG